MLALKPGTLVQVQPDKVISHGDREIIAEDGLLWIVSDSDNAPRIAMDDLYWCRSLATGEEHCWYIHELKVAPTEEATDEVCRGGNLQYTQH